MIEFIAGIITTTIVIKKWNKIKEFLRTTSPEDLIKRKLFGPQYEVVDWMDGTYGLKRKRHPFRWKSEFRTCLFKYGDPDTFGRWINISNIEKRSLYKVSKEDFIVRAPIELTTKQRDELFKSISKS